ncbi:serine protease [Candidatus Uhrbacteria bacterium]|nr:serine protease [Candidatus Uhrbacteria bacterium]
MAVIPPHTMKIPFFHSKKHSPHRVGMLVSIFCVSLIAGYFGSMLGVSREGGDTEVRPPVVIEDRTRPLQKPTSAADSVYSDVRPSIVALYRASERDLRKAWTESALTRGQLLGYALSITSDGWLATTVPVRKEDLSTILVIDRDRAAYRPDRVVEDTATPARYLKISARGLKPAQLSGESVPIVQDGYLVSDQNAEQTSLSLPSYPSLNDPTDALQSTDTLAKRLNRETVFGMSGLPLVNLSREVVGLTENKGAVPLSYIARGVRNILKTGAIARPKAGLSYFDNAFLSYLPRGMESVGATIIEKKGAVSVPTPTGAGRLLSGDVITGVNADTVSAQRSLSELLNEYQPNDPVQLHIKRGNQSLTLTLVLQ